MKSILIVIVSILSLTTHSQDFSDRILMVKLYNSDHFKTEQLDSTLQTNGFEIDYINALPSSEEFGRLIYNYDQLWIVSDYKQHFDSSYMPDLDNYIQSGNSLYLLADNEPYDVDVEFLSQRYAGGVTFEGNYIADKGGHATYDCDLIADNSDTPLYEGFTVSSIKMTEAVKPQYIGSEGQVFIASYNDSNSRILLDGGFTRMYTKWTLDSADYYLMAAIWLSK